MRKKYAIAYCDGYYITENGRGILDLAHTQDQEFAIFVRDALNAAEQSVNLTLRHVPAWCNKLIRASRR